MVNRREEWRKVLQGELLRWSSMSFNDVLAELRTRDVYEVVAESKHYQVEAVLLENTLEYLHVSIGVDDGSFLGSIHPESESFICRKLRPRPGDCVILKECPPGLLNGLPIADQQAISAIIGKPVKLIEFGGDGRAELEFVDAEGVIHFLFVSPDFISIA